MQQVNGDDIFVLGFDHNDSYFQHAILVLEDYRTADYLEIEGPRQDNVVFNEFNIYVGDSEHYTENFLC